jgi:hypothetical protein
MNCLGLGPIAPLPPRRCALISTPALAGTCGLVRAAFASALAKECRMSTQTPHITENEILEFEYGLLEDGDLEEYREIVCDYARSMIAEIRRLRLGANQTDLTGLARWKISEWHCLGDGVFWTATPFGKLRQFLRAVADQKTDHPSLSKLYGDSGLLPFEVETFCGMCRDAGVNIDWTEGAPQ